MHEFTQEQIDAERPKQKRLYEAGYAGITWPKEFGGQGLSPAHERAFLEEAGEYELPNFGIAGGTTFGVCAPVMLAHGPTTSSAVTCPGSSRATSSGASSSPSRSPGPISPGVQTRATRDGDSWILNGAKVWSSWAHLAD